ncbi:MAG: hypothetical protein ACI4OZ_09250 [Akkermansia sp.]
MNKKAKTAATAAASVILNMAATIILFCSEPSHSSTIALYAFERLSQAIGASVLYAASFWLMTRILPHDFLEE